MSSFDLDAVLAGPRWFPSTLDRLYAMVASGTLAPHVGLVLPLARAAEAPAALEGWSSVGKVVLSVGSPP